MVNASIAEISCQTLAEVTESGIIPKISAFTGNQLLPIIVSFIIIPMVIFFVTSMFTFAGRKKIQQSTAIWSYFIALLLSAIFGLMAYFTLITWV